MKIFRFPLIVLLLFITSGNTYNQRNKIRFDRISIDAGLSQSSVISIFQDKKGFMWFGTYDGLNRYDGYTFKIFRNNPDDEASISQNLIRSIYEDRFGTMWVGTENGLNKYNNKKEIFKRYLNKPGDSSSLSSSFIRDIFEDNKGELWFATDNGINRYDRKHDNFIRMNHNPDDQNTISGNFVWTITQDRNGNYWIGTNDGLDFIDGRTGNFSHYRNNPADIYSISDNIITSVLQDSYGIIWVGTRNGGLNSFNPNSKKFRHYTHSLTNKSGVSSNIIRRLLEDRDGNLWILTHGGGLQLYNRKLDTFITYKYDFSDPSSLSSNVLHTIYEDQSGILWIGADFGGICKFDKLRNQFILYRTEPGNVKSLTNNSIITLYEDPDDEGKNVWLGTWGGGLGLFNRKTEEFTFFTNNLYDKNSLSSNIVRSITKDRSGIFWIGTDLGVTRWDRKKNKFYRYTYQQNNPSGIQHNMIKMIYEDKAGRIWIATNGGGIDLYDPRNDNFIHHRSAKNIPNSLSDNTVWCMLEDSKGNFWLGTNSGGLNLFDRETGKFKVYMRDPADKNSLSNNKILCIAEGRNNLLWIGTAGGGLNKFDPSTGKFSVYTEADGLASNTVHGIVEDENRNLWVSTTMGLSKFNPEKKTFVTYTAQDGLQSNEFHVNSCLKSVTGELFFGGINGFNVFRPANLKENNSIPPLVFTDFQLYNKSVPIGIHGRNKLLLSSITETKKIELSYHEEVFSIEFSALDFGVPNKNQYAYKMEGIDNEWNYIGTRRYATYTKLPAGEYTFRVKGANHFGIWNEKGITLQVIITPPFWNTWWSRILSMLIIIGFAILIFKWRTRRIILLNEALEERVRERTTQLEAANKEMEAFTYSVSHDLRAPLRAIDGYTKIFLEEYEKSVDDEGRRILSVISSSTRRMGSLINDLLSLSRIGRSEVVFSTTDMYKIVNSVVKENQLNNQSIYTINIDRLPAIPGDPSLLRQVWANLISNAFKFTSKTDKPVIEIGFEDKENEVVYFIKDNGAGFSKEYAHKLFGVFQRLHKESEFEGTGVGLAIVQRIVNRHGGTIWGDGEQGKGASFYFTLKKDHNGKL